MRSGRAGLLLGLVLLVTAHLAGAVHVSAVAGPPVSVEAAEIARPLHDAGRESEPAPEHQHRSGDHIDHAADRPRTAVDETIVEPGHADPADSPFGAVDGPPSPAVRCRPSGPAASGTDAPDTLALHCVRRL
ncbi:hypothetical protein AVL59_26930 [Streptomyces griseochromogenes]|nr:hypothetical protein AVL59_26930 [Streptomyces griseochromogenes]